VDEEAAAILDQESGNLKGNCGIHGRFKGGRHSNQMGGGGTTHDRDYDFQGYHDTGGASRFFYCAKASSSERNEGLENSGIKNIHATVKPLKLMKYLIKLVMPPTGGLLLDPFAGSGTTILAAKNLGFDAIGIEKDPEYCEIAKARIENFQEKIIIGKNQQLELFAQVG
jgi:DNA modification methylase